MAARVTHHIDIEAYGEIQIMLIPGYNEVGLIIADCDHGTRIAWQLSPDESKSLRAALKAVEKTCDGDN